MYREDERQAAGQFIHDTVFNDAMASPIIFATETVARRLADQMPNCFAWDECTAVTDDQYFETCLPLGCTRGELGCDCHQVPNPAFAWREHWKTPGVGRSVSPDNFLFWDPPPIGVYGHTEPFVFRPSEVRHVHTWQPAVDSGILKGQVWFQGQPDAGAEVTLYSQPVGDPPPLNNSITVITDASGAYEIDPAPGGWNEIRAIRLENGAACYDSWWQTVNVLPRINTDTGAPQETFFPLTLNGPDATERTVSFSGNMFIRDDEGSDAPETGTIPFSGSCVVNPSARVGYPTVVGDRGCVGDEVRVFLEIECNYDPDNVVGVLGHLRLFEGASCSTTDLDGEGWFSLSLSPDGSLHVLQPQPFTVNNTDEGGDRIDLTIAGTNSVKRCQ